MKRKLLPLLCALILCVPGLCASEMTEVPYPCDAEGCGYEGPFSVVVTGTETRDGAPGEWISVQCPQCGTPLLTSWRQTGPAEPPATAEPPREDPPPAEPEPPVTAPPATDPPTAAPPPTQPPEARPPETAPPQVTLPPVPAETPPPAVGGGGAESGRTPEPDPGESGTNAGTEEFSGSRNGQKRRNLQKYPYFSSFWPARRLNLEGDPDAWAPVPGIRIYPAEESTSILQHMLDGE